MAKNRDEPAGGGVVTEAATAAEPAAKKKAAGDPVLRAIGRITRYLETLTPKAQRRVGRFLADWLDEKADEGK